MIDTNKIEQIAHLARMELSEEEKQAFIKDLAVVFEWADQLNAVSYDGLENEDLALIPSREDKGISYQREDILANAPQKDQDMFLVPKVLS